MTTIRPTTTTTVRSTSTAAPAAPTAPQTNAQASTAAGYPTASSFTPSSSASASTGATDANHADSSTVKKAVDILGKTSGGEELKKLLETGYFTGDDGQKAADAFNKIAGSLSAEDAETIKGAMGYATALGGAVQMGKMFMEKIINKMKEDMAKFTADLKENFS